MSSSEVSHASDAKYFVQILGGICIVGALVIVFFKKAHFVSIGLIFVSVLGLLLVQFAMTLQGPAVSISFMSILKKIFHFRNLICMIILTAWVFDIYINNYDDIQNDKMPSEFYTLSNSFTFILIIQVIVVISKFGGQKATQANLEKQHGSDDVFKKMTQLYNAQTSSLNAIFNAINLILVLMMYVTSTYFTTDG